MFISVCISSTDPLNLASPASWTCAPTASAVSPIVQAPQRMPAYSYAASKSASAWPTSKEVLLPSPGTVPSRLSTPARHPASLASGGDPRPRSGQVLVPVSSRSWARQHLARNKRKLSAPRLYLRSPECLDACSPGGRLGPRHLPSHRAAVLHRPQPPCTPRPRSSS